MLGSLADIEQVSSGSQFVEALKSDKIRITNVDSGMMSCLGSPSRIRYLDNNILVSFDTQSFKDDKRVRIKANLAWNVGESETKRLDDETANSLAEEAYTYCFFNNENEVPDIEQMVKEGSSKVAVIESLSQTSEDRLTCKRSNKRYWRVPIACHRSLGTSSHGYCNGFGEFGSSFGAVY